MRKKHDEDKPIVFVGDEDDVVYCGICDYRLIPWKDQQILCPNCEKMYNPQAVLLHHQTLGPVDAASGDDDEVVLIPLTRYHDKKKSSSNKSAVLDREDRAMAASRFGFSWTSVETWWPEGEGEED
jgi:hypothetical protein